MKGQWNEICEDVEHYFGEILRRKVKLRQLWLVLDSDYDYLNHLSILDHVDVDDLVLIQKLI